MKKLMIDTFKLLFSFTEDFLILGGLIIIVLVTFKINYYAGMYLLGAILILFGIMLSKYTLKEPKRR